MTSFAEAMARFKPGLPLGVALSGGADSTALLVACARRWPGQVHAIHVNHGLQIAAIDFEVHCQRLCAALKVPLRIRRVDARPQAGESPEDAARRARYAAIVAAALADTASGAINNVAIQHMALAQHADDQVETIMLALSRGGGLPGLAAMAPSWERAGLQWYRPLLDVPGAQIRAWLQAEGIDWIEDPTNADQTLTRNRIRHHLLPGLAQVFPGFRETFARSARHAAQAQALLIDVAEGDLRELGVPPSVAGLQALSRPRQSNALRHWLKQQHQTTPSEAQMSELLSQVAACTTRGHAIAIKIGWGMVVREGDRLGFHA